MIVGVGCWFAFVPLRLRGALVLGIGLAGAGALAGWALATNPLTDNNVALASRSTAGHGFGIVLFCVLLALLGAGMVAACAMDRTELAPDVRKRIATVLVTLVALLPLAGVVALAGSSRGFTGEISHAWHSLTTQNYTVFDTKNRIGSLESSRARDWNEGVKVAEHALLKGVGALGYGTARTRYTTDVLVVQHAHSYVIETFADFGLLGLALNLALLVSWALACARTVGVRTREIPAELAPERAGLLTLLCIVIVFGVHSAIDWTWFVPGTAITALLCAGWLAGRGPLAQPVGRLARRRRLTARPALGAATIGICGVALLAGWAVWQPLHAANAYNAALQRARPRRHEVRIRRRARRRRARSPVSPAVVGAIGCLQRDRGPGVGACAARQGGAVATAESGHLVAARRARPSGKAAGQGPRGFPEGVVAGSDLEAGDDRNRAGADRAAGRRRKVTNGRHSRSGAIYLSGSKIGFRLDGHSSVTTRRAGARGLAADLYRTGGSPQIGSELGNGEVELDSDRVVDQSLLDQGRPPHREILFFMLM